MKKNVSNKILSVLLSLLLVLAAPLLGRFHLQRRAGIKPTPS